ncbi:hypothetical protein GP486_003278 [Trichoglossum hirsutum]|uniref:PNPLA domain-containing protein n=1 Tax=Trichoglossum hirsutum TaxID=265104 RepID=A0A9P8LDE4_9PEZI|nr:hypothetical protein GP486_003278 [Trichoglossum hirsutum]
MEKPRRMRLLSIDGGGIRGLASLLILKRIMDKINEDRAEALKPHEMFDLIGGIGTGGIIALLLGRMQMPVEEAENVFCDILGKLFRGSHLHHEIQNLLNDSDTADELIQKIHNLEKEKAEFDITPIKNYIKNLGDIGDTLLKDPTLDTSRSPCRVFVGAFHEGDDLPRILRNYRNPRWPQVDFDTLKVWEAACATAATTTSFTLFDGVQSDPTQKFGTAPLKWNNPVRLVHHEAQELWPDSQFLMLSVGAGGAPKGETDLEAIVKEAEKVDTEFSSDNEAMVHHLNFFRLNVMDGMDKIGPAELKHKPELSQTVDIYLNLPTVELAIQVYIKSLIEDTRGKKFSNAFLTKLRTDKDIKIHRSYR